MDSDQGKLFIGGVSWETTEEKLKDHFEKYGEVTQAVIMRDKVTGRPRGFGFVVFADPSLLDRVLQDKHTIDGRTVEAKRALSREEQQISSRSGNASAGRNSGAGGNVRTKKIFVGGLPSTLTEEAFRQYFEQYGNVTDVVVMYDQSTQRPRGFGFISFESEDAVDRVLHKTFHDLNGKLVEVKRALPKEANPGGGGRTGGGSYQSYGAAGSNNNSYDGRMDANRYGQPPAGGGFAYGSSGYGAPSYGYGTAANGNVGYPGYGVGGYGSAPPNAGYTGPAGGYVNASGPTSGYVSGPPGAPRSPWSNQPPTAYGMQGNAAGYGVSAGYGGPAPWNTSGAGGGVGSGGAPSGPAGQSPGGGAGFNNANYGYGYGEGSYGGNPGSYGAVGGRSGSVPNNASGGINEQSGGSGSYMGGGYSEANGNSGYPNAMWRSDPSQGMTQGGGYGVPQANGAPGVQAGYGGYGAANRQIQ
ncbi:heterogeneous nuclear ribonucleoprotein 1-like [Nymphaea colorata]|nr:heterogeneous nuclear ribonucleoprotein 1-like [Nymphaea colorata]